MNSKLRICIFLFTLLYLLSSPLKAKQIEESWKVHKSIPQEHAKLIQVSEDQINYLLKHLKTYPVSQSLTEPQVKKSSIQSLLKVLKALSQGGQIKQKDLENNFYFLSPKQEPKTFLTGYYTPTFKASLSKSKHYPYPLYKKPKGVFQHTRKAIETKQLLSNQNLELVYLSSKLDAYLIHVQGSATLSLNNGKTLSVAFDTSNQLPYTSLGKLLIQDGHIDEKNISLASIRKFFKQYPDKLDHYLQQNDRYIFFKQATTDPTGSTGSKVYALHSLASEKFKNGEYRYPPYMPTLLIFKNKSLPASRIAFHQDTGSAIKGIQRFDLYTGVGKQAETIAGPLKEQIPFYILWPKSLALPKKLAGIAVEQN